MKKITLLMLILTTVMACFMLTSCLGDTPSEDEECEKHIYKPWKILEEATCEKTGLKQRYCIYCGEIQTEVIPTSGHVIAKLPAKAQTCKKEGLTEGEKCSVCNEILVAQEVIAPHFMSLTDELDPTCTELGMKKYECEKCDHVQVEVLEAYGHVPETVLGYEETCTEAGLSDGSKCAICDEVLQAQQTIEPAHKPMVVKGYASSCTETGLTDGKKCERCDEILVEQKEIAALGHNKLTVPAKAPTCKETGLTSGEKCSRCDEIFVAQEIVDVIPCNKQTYVSGKAATCQEVGYTEGYKCSMCGEMQEGGEEIAIVPCNKDVFVKGKDSTCNVQGTADGYKCSMCGEMQEGGETLPLGDHVKGTVINEGLAPTCTTPGVAEVYICKDCGTMIGGGMLPIKEHTAISVDAREATCSDYGYTSGTQCADCDLVLSGCEFIPKKAHTYTNGICTVCDFARCVEISQEEFDAIMASTGFTVKVVVPDRICKYYGKGNAIKTTEFIDGVETTIGYYVKDGENCYIVTDTGILGYAATPLNTIVSGMGGIMNFAFLISDATVNGEHIDEIKYEHLVYNEDDGTYTVTVEWSGESNLITYHFKDGKLVYATAYHMTRLYTEYWYMESYEDADFKVPEYSMLDNIPIA
ncbi:MAG: hypothetical protein IJC80_03010 [Clostridia bacterium]|nr:hypothetical protein [Clostridia bacterium]